MRGGRYIVLALTFYAFFLLLTFPAARAVRMIRQRVELPAENLRISGVDGRWLNGRAQVVVVDNIELTNLHWRINILPIFIGRLQCELDADVGDGRLQAVFSLGRNDLLIKDIVGQIPAALFDEATSPFGVKLAGNFAVDLTKVHLHAGRLQVLTGDLAWRAAGIGGSQELEFGDIQVKLAADDDKINLTLSDGGGPLQLTGAGDLRPGGKYTFTGFVAVRQSASPELGDAVRLLGESGSDGRVTLSYRGSLPGLQ